MGRPQILIVEDDGIVALDFLRRVIKMGFDCSQVSSTADDGIMQATRCKPSLILMDINLKGKPDGVTAARTIRSSLGIPVVFITAYSDRDTLNRAKASRPYGYLLKPCKETDLRMTIYLALQNHAIAKRLEDDQSRIATTLSNIANRVMRGRELMRNLDESFAEANGSDVESVILTSSTSSSPG